MSQDQQVPGWARFFSPPDFYVFVATVEAEMQRRDLSYEVGDGVVDVVFPGRRTMHFGLLNLAQLCHHLDPETWPDVVANHFDSMLVVRADSDAVDRESFEGVADRLKIRLHDVSFATNAELRLLHRAIAPGLLGVLVYDLPMSVATVLPEQAARWGRSEDELFDLALANVLLEDPFDIETLELGNGARIAMLMGDSFFTATHVLALDHHVDSGPHGAIVAVPNRHLVLHHSIEDLRVVNAIDTIALAAHRRHAEGPGSITPQLYWRRPLGRAGYELVPLPAEVEAGLVNTDPPPVFVDEVLSFLAH